MPVITPTPPHESVSAFSHGLPAFLSGSPSGTVVSETYVGATPQIPSVEDVGMGSGQVPGPPNIPAVLEAFVLSLEQAANNTGVVSPARTGWSFFAGGAKDKTVLGRVVQRRHAWKLVGVNYGDLVWETLNATLALISSPPAVIPAGDYELRMLAIPGLNLQVFWLASQQGSADLIIPAPAPVTSIHLPYPLPPWAMPHFLAEIRPLAANLLKMPAHSGA
jgi:hypothetical protein